MVLFNLHGRILQKIHSILVDDDKKEDAQGAAPGARARPSGHTFVKGALGLQAGEEPCQGGTSGAGRNSEFIQ